MFDEAQLNEFINRMFYNAKNSNHDIKEALETFRKYLEETSMCTPEYLKKLDKIIECSDELTALKTKIGLIDVTTLIPGEPVVIKRTAPASHQKKIGSMPKSNSTRKREASYTCSGSNSPSYSSSCGGSSYSSSC